MTKKYKKINKQKPHSFSALITPLLTHIKKFLVNIYKSVYFWPLIIPIIIGLIIFAQTFWYEFLSYDDQTHIPENPYFHPVSLSSLLYLWFNPYFGLYVPFTYTMWAIAYLISTKAGWFHFINLCIHLANSSLIFALILKIIKKTCSNSEQLSKAQIIPITLALLIFTTHPLQVQAIAWISEFRGLLAVFLSLISIHLWFLSTKPSYFLSLIIFALGMLSKPNVSYVPATLVLFSYLFNTKSILDIIKKTYGYFLVSFVVIILNKQVQSDEGAIEFFPTIFQKIKIATAALSFYLKNLFWPTSLMPIYLRSAKNVVQEPWDFIGIILILTLLLIAFISFVKKRHIIFIGASLIFLGVGPVLGLVNFKYQNFSIVADHYFYFSIAGVSILITGLILELKTFSNSYNIVFVILIGINIILATLSFNQTKIWTNDDVFYMTLIEKNPNHYIAYSVLGNLRSKQLRFAEALRYLYKAYDLNKEHYLTHQNLGVVLLNTQQYQKIIDLSKEWFPINTVKLKSYSSAIAHMYFNVGLAHYMLQQFKEAKPYFEQSIKIAPFNYTHEAHKFLGDIYYQEGNFAKAKEEYNLYLKIAPPYDRYRESVLQTIQKISINN